MLPMVPLLLILPLPHPMPPHLQLPPLPPPHSLLLWMPLHFLPQSPPPPCLPINLAGLLLDLLLRLQPPCLLELVTLMHRLALLKHHALLIKMQL
jgi:hypothetical protein